MLGFVVAVAAQRLTPIAGPPLYDGVVVEAPYLWLAPPAGHSGGATGVTQTIAVQGNQSPNIGVGTGENPPQIGVFAGAGDLAMPAGTSLIEVSIAPVPPPAQPSVGVIAGNVYRVSLTTQDGRAVTGLPTGGVTVELRGPTDSSNATIERFSGGRWIPLASDSVGVPNMYAAGVTDFGDFAIVAQPDWTPSPDGGGGGGGGGGASDGNAVVIAEAVIAAALVAIALLGLPLHGGRKSQPAHRSSSSPTPIDADRTTAQPDKPPERKRRGH